MWPSDKTTTPSISVARVPELRVGVAMARDAHMVLLAPRNAAASVHNLSCWALPRRRRRRRRRRIQGGRNKHKHETLRVRSRAGARCRNIMREYIACQKARCDFLLNIRRGAGNSQYWQYANVWRARELEKTNVTNATNINLIEITDDYGDDAMLPAWIVRMCAYPYTHTHTQRTTKADT